MVDLQCRGCSKVYKPPGGLMGGNSMVMGLTIAWCDAASSAGTYR